MIKYTKYLLVSLLLFVGVAQAQTAAGGLFRREPAYYTRALKPQTDGGADLGTSSLGFGALYLSDATKDFSITFVAGSNVDLVAEGNLVIKAQSQSVMNFYSGGVYSPVNGQSTLGLNGYAFKSLYLSDGTSTASLTFDASHNLEISSGNLLLLSGGGGSSEIVIASTYINFAVDQYLNAGDAEVEITNGTSLMACDSAHTGMIGVDTNSDCAGGAANGALCVCANGSWQEIKKW